MPAAALWGAWQLHSLTQSAKYVPPSALHREGNRGKDGKCLVLNHSACQCQVHVWGHGKGPPGPELASQCSSRNPLCTQASWPRDWSSGAANNKQTRRDRAGLPMENTSEISASVNNAYIPTQALLSAIMSYYCLWLPLERRAYRSN